MTNTTIAYKYLHERGVKSPYVPGLPARDILEHELLSEPGWQELLETHVTNDGSVYERVPAKKTSKTTTIAEPVADA